MVVDGGHTGPKKGPNWGHVSFVAYLLGICKQRKQTCGPTFGGGCALGSPKSPAAGGSGLKAQVPEALYNRRVCVYALSKKLCRGSILE